MDSIIEFEKVKNPTIAFIGGILLGGYVVWHSVTNLNDQLIKTLEATKVELEHQVATQAKSITEKDTELNNLHAKLLTKTPTIATSLYKPGSELKDYISRLDNEIVTIKYDLDRNSRLGMISASGKNESPKSDEYIRIEKELQALYQQRDLAAKKLINILN